MIRTSGLGKKALLKKRKKKEHRRRGRGSSGGVVRGNPQRKRIHRKKSKISRHAVSRSGRDGESEMRLVDNLGWTLQSYNLFLKRGGLPKR